MSQYVKLAVVVEADRVGPGETEEAESRRSP